MTRSPPPHYDHVMLVLVFLAVLLGLLIYVGSFLHRQAQARGPRKNTNHLRKIRKQVRGESDRGRRRKR